MPIQLNSGDLRIIKLLELDILKEIDNVCRRNNIEYSIAFGTLLGAVRHGGFIPWDDDIDIVLLRKDYDRFLEVAREGFSDRLLISNYETNEYIGEPFTKIMMKDTVMLERFARNSGAPAGVFVDVFPLDNAPDREIQRLFHRLKNYSLRKMILLASNYDFHKSGVKRYVYDFLTILAKNKKSYFTKLYRRNQKKYNKQNTSCVVVTGGNYGYKKDCLPREMFQNYTDISFEGHNFMTIEKYRDFLTHYYSDYMKLPPVESRINKHTVEKLDLTKFGGRKI